MSSNLTTSVSDQATDRLTFTDRTPLLKPDFTSWVLLTGFMLPSIFNLWVIFIWCCAGLMMCSIHIDESTIHVSNVAWPSHLCVPLSKKLNSLLDRLDNRRMMNDFQCNTCKWTRVDQNDAHYYSATTLPSYKYLLRLVLITISHSFTFFA
jgi:hypothetical protein